ILDRARRDRLSGERGDDCRASARRVQGPHPGQRPRVPLRDQRADRADGGSHRCRPIVPPMETRAEIDRAAIAGCLVAAMREAGTLACSFGRPIKSWTKHGDSPVTEADIAVDKLLRERLTGAFPSFGWLSEESEDDLARLHVRHVWIVDPIDGTRAFL